MPSAEKTNEMLNKTLGPVIGVFLLIIVGVVAYENRGVLDNLSKAKAEVDSVRKPVNPADLRPPVSQEQLEYQKGLERSINPNNFTLPEIQPVPVQISPPPPVRTR